MKETTLMSCRPGVDPDEILSLLVAPSQNSSLKNGSFTKLHFKKMAPSQSYILIKHLLHKIPLCEINLFTKFKYVKMAFSGRKCHYKGVIYQVMAHALFNKTLLIRKQI